jgi:NAD+ kinase
MLALTPVAAFHPRGWRGALLPAGAHIRLYVLYVLYVLDADKRAVRAAADHREVPDVREAVVTDRPELTMTLQFDPHHMLEGRRILAEQLR